jgi:hypothetical protein
MRIFIDYGELSNLQLTCLKECYIRRDLFVNNMADPENVKSYMSYVQQYTQIIKIPTLKTYFS